MNYCVGFIFNEDLTRIILIKKNRGPDCVKNKLNGIGGKIEKDESGIDAIIRECKEETGLEINNWFYFCELDCNEGKIYFYYAVTDDLYNYKQIEDEKIGIYRLDDFDEYTNEDYEWLDFQDMVCNLNWLIPMSLNHYRKLDPTKIFIIKELY